MIAIRQTRIILEKQWPVGSEIMECNGEMKLEIKKE